MRLAIGQSPMQVLGPVIYQLPYRAREHSSNIHAKPENLLHVGRGSEVFCGPQRPTTRLVILLRSSGKRHEQQTRGGGYETANSKLQPCRAQARVTFHIPASLNCSIDILNAPVRKAALKP
jgi:hypothetical protein